MRIRYAVAALVVSGAVASLACSSDDDSKAGTGSSSSGGSSTSSGNAASSSSSSGENASSSSSSTGGPPVADDGILPSDSVWRTKNEFYRAIDGAPVAEHSNAMIAALGAWGLNDTFQIDFSFSVLDGTGGTPTKMTALEAQEEADDVPVPVPTKGYIEGDHPYDGCAVDEDCHMLIVDPGNKKLFEVYQAHKNANGWDGYVALWQLDKAYPRTNRGKGCTSADAAGLPITPGLIGYKETKAGAIEHALRFIIRNQYIRGVAGSSAVPNNVYPASHGSTASDSATGIPYGGRLRLKSSFQDDDPRVKSPGAKAIVKALKKYGMILADGGNIPLVAESVKVHQDKDPAATWEGILGSKDVGFIRPSDFEVIAIPKGDPSQPNAGWLQTKTEYEGAMNTPLGCNVVVQP